MPLRRIPTSLPKYGFADDPSPLTEGLANAAATLGELWPRLRQIEADKQESAAARQERDQERRDRRAERSDDQEGRFKMWDTERGDRINQTKETNALREREIAEREKENERRDLADLDQRYGQQSVWHAQVAERKAAAEAARLNAARKQAEDEIGSLDGDTTTEKYTDQNGNVRTTVLKPTMSPKARAERAAAIDARTKDILAGKPIMVPKESTPPPGTDAPAPRGEQPAPIAPQAEPQQPAPESPGLGARLWDGAKSVVTVPFDWAFGQSEEPPTEERGPRGVTRSTDTPTGPTNARDALVAAGIDPMPEAGVTLDELTSKDPAVQSAALMRLPPVDRVKAIDELLKFGYK